MTAAARAAAARSLNEERSSSNRFLDGDRGGLGKPSAAVLAGVKPAALRALGEAAIPQVRAYYVASLDYGRSTTPDDGLYYLGTAQAQRELTELCRRLSTPSTLRPPPLRSL